MLAMTLIEKIEKYCCVAGIAETTFGKLVSRDTYLVKRIREERATMAVVRRTEEWMKANPAKSLKSA